MPEEKPNPWNITQFEKLKPEDYDLCPKHGLQLNGFKISILNDDGRDFRITRNYCIECIIDLFDEHCEEIFPQNMEPTL